MGNRSSCQHLIVTFILVFVSSHFSYAIDPVIPEGGSPLEVYNSGGESGSGFQFPGEQVDYRTGSVTHEVEDFRWPGPNGMDIVIARSYGKSVMPRWDVGYGWDLEIPRIFTEMGTSCASQRALMNPKISGLFQLVLPGSAPISFVKPLASHPLEFDADYVSSNFWIAKCVGTDRNDFLITSPNGRKYFFKAFGNRSNYYKQLTKLTAKLRAFYNFMLYVSEESNQYGDYIRYSYSSVYEGCDYNRNIIDQISSSDGRIVKFRSYSRTFQPNYQECGSVQGIPNNQSYLSGFSASGSTTVNGSSYPMSKNFEYVGVNGVTTTLYGSTGKRYCQGVLDPTGSFVVCMNIYPILTEVRRPDGTAWKYNYDYYINYGYNSSGKLTIPISIFDRVTRATSPNGLVANYTFTDTTTLVPFGIRSKGGSGLALTARSLAGPGMSSPISASYKYYVQGSSRITTDLEFTYENNTETTSVGGGWRYVGDRFSYSFETSGGKVIARRYDRGFLPEGYSRKEAAWERHLLFDQIIFPSTSSSESDLYNQTLQEESNCKGSGLCQGEITSFEYERGPNFGYTPPAGAATAIVEDGIYVHPEYVQPGHRTEPKRITIHRKTGKYVTEISRNSLFLPETIREYLANSTTEYREKKLTYFSNVDSVNNVVGLPKTESVTGIPGLMSREYSTTGQLISENNYGIISKYTYYPDGNLQSTSKRKNGNDFVTAVFSDYKLGQAQASTNAMKITMRRKIDDFGREISSTDGRGFTTTTDYDLMDRKIRVQPPKPGSAPRILSYPDGNTTIEDNGKLKTTSINSALGQPIYKETEDRASGKRIVSKIDYDEFNRKKFESLPDVGRASNYGNRFTYDILNRIIAVENTANGGVTYYDFQPQDKVLVTKPPTENGEHRMRISYRNFGGPKEMVPIKIESEYEPFGLNALDQGQANPKVIITEMNKDVLGKILSVGQYLFSTRQWVSRYYGYNSSQLIDWISEPERQDSVTKEPIKVHFSYEPGSATLLKKEFRSSSRIYRSENYSYNLLLQLSSVDHAGTADDVTYSYDPNGKTKSVATGNGVIRNYSYDENGNKIIERLTVAGKVFDTFFAYNDIDQLIQVTYPNLNTVHPGLNSQNTSNITLDGTGNAIAIGDVRGSSQIIRSADYHVNNMYKEIYYGNNSYSSMELTDTLSPEKIFVRTSGSPPASSSSSTTLPGQSGVTTTTQASTSSTVPTSTSTTTPRSTTTLPPGSVEL